MEEADAAQDAILIELVQNFLTTFLNPISIDRATGEDFIQTTDIGNMIDSYAGFHVDRGVILKTLENLDYTSKLVSDKIYWLARRT